MRMAAMVVVGNVVSGQFVSDLKITIPYKASVQITMNQYMASRELQKAIQERKVLVLQGPPIVGGRVAEPALARLNDENQKLRKENDDLLSQLQSRTDEVSELKSSMSDQERKLDAILGALERLESAPRVQQVLTTVAGQGAATGPSAVVDDGPLYIPEDINEAAQKAEGTVDVEAREVEGVKTAVNALRKLKKGSAPKKTGRKKT